MLDDRFQQVDVVGEGFFSGGGQRAGRVRTIVLKGFGDGNISRLLQSTDVRRKVSVRHRKRIAQFGERQFRRGGQHGHYRKPPFLVDNAIELEKWFRVHAAFFRCSVK